MAINDGGKAMAMATTAATGWSLLYCDIDFLKGEMSSR